jgi:predicted heme/steroid binding protein
VERVYSQQELLRYNGEDESDILVAYQGVVYDVSDCPRWRSGLHEGQHFPGQDLTQAMPDAPHLPDVLTRPCVKRVGLLKMPKPDPESFHE